MLLGEHLHCRFCLGPLGTLGCWAWGPAVHSQDWQMEAQGSWQEWQAGHTLAEVLTPRGAAFSWHRAELSWQAEHPHPSGDGAGGDGDLLLPVPQQPPTQDLWRGGGGGRLFWHHLLALPLAARGRNHVPCSKQCYHGRIRPCSRNADVTACPGHSLAGPRSPSPGRVDLQIINGAALFPRGQDWIRL